MNPYDYDVIVIGGGACGLTASSACASVGKKTLLIEKEKELGGDCLHYGCVPSKSLIKSAYCYNVLKNAQTYGLPKIDPPPVDYQKVKERIQGIIASIQIHDSPEHLKKKYNVQTRFGRPQFLDNHTIDLEGKKLAARNFVIATGSSAAIPPIEGLRGVGYLTNADIFSLERLPQSLIVLGAGPIGLEMAQAFGRLGTRVTVVEALGQVLAKEDDDIGRYVNDQLQKEGIRILLNTKAVKAAYQNNQVELTLEGETGKQMLAAEKILIAVGRKPNIEGLNLEKASVAYSKSGIKVNGRLQTSTNNIYACGDVKEGYQFTHVAGYEAGIAMMNICFPIVPILRIPVKANYTNIPWCTYLDPEVASVGFNERRAREAGLKYSVHKEDLKNNDRARAESETEGFIKIMIHAGKPIGAQIVAFHASDLIHEWVAVLNGKVGLRTLAQAVHAYPTLSEISKTASLNYFLNAPPLTKLRMILNI